jgi:opacity protein-like surface antigen
MSSMLNAGIALAALTGAVTVAGHSAIAADLGGSAKDGYLAPMPQISRGVSGPCYVRADVGYAVSADPDVKWPVTNSIFTDNDGGGDAVVTDDELSYEYQGDSVSNVSLDNTWFGAVGAGCGSGSRGIRGEVMLGYHGKRKLDGEPLLFERGPEVGDPEPTPGTPIEDPLHTDITSYSLMVNAYKDFGTFRGFTPYVGAGIGVAYNITDEVYFTQNPDLTNRIRGDRDISFAWALMAGVGYNLSERTILDVGYRYLDLGEAGSENIDSALNYNPRVRIDDLASHEIKVGLRYHFGQTDCCGEFVPVK